jgi:hypothetical protein
VREAQVGQAQVAPTADVREPPVLLTRHPLFNLNSELKISIS